MFSLLCVKYDMLMHEMMMGMYKLFCRFGLKENALNRVVTTKVVQVELDMKTLLQRTQEEANLNILDFGVIDTSFFDDPPTTPVQDPPQDAYESA
jgi:DNA-binding Xre family transcriptional regulator